MATETEIGLRVEDFMGINVQVSSEDLKDYYFKKTQNLYERKLGELQRRGGSSVLNSVAMPTNITSIDSSHTIYDKILGKTKVLKVSCQTMGAMTSPNSYFTWAGCVASWVADVNGKWGSGPVGITNAFIGAANTGFQDVVMMATGFGGGIQINNAPTPGGVFPVSGDTKKLRIVISAPCGNSNITGLDVYVKILTSYTAGNPGYAYVVIGHIDLIATPTGTFDFFFGPITMGADPGAPQEVGNTFPSYTASPNFSGSGSLVVGKTYYVAVLSQHLKYNASSVLNRSVWNTQSSTAVTIGSGQDSILVAVGTANSASTMIAIGLHPQTMVPIGIVSQLSTFNYTINNLPGNSMGVLGATPQSSSVTEYDFIVPSSGSTDMFAKLDSNGNWVALPINNFTIRNRNSPAANPDTTNNIGFTGQGFTTVSSNARYISAQYFSFTQDMLYLVGRNRVGQTGDLNTLATNDITHNLVQCDGNACSMAVMDFGNASPPRSSVISVFKEKLILGGGQGAAYNKAHFSNPFNPYSFGIPGALSTLQYVQVESGGEEISGMGIYTNTTAQTGPIAQFVLGKANSLYILTDFPVYDSTGTVNNAVMTNLSRKVGISNHDTVRNSEIGLIITSNDNVWLVRESGEPTPLGHEISYFLRPEDPTQTVNTELWNAVVHDGRYKLSFSINGATEPSRELWLNIAKMKQLKGEPAWEGPHLGRVVSHSSTEERFFDNIIPKRVCVDHSGLHWYQADKEDVVQDFSTDIATILGFRDYPLGDPNANKLFTRNYWRLKCDTDLTFQEVTTVLSEGGETVETLNRLASKLADHSGGTYQAFLTTRAKIYQFFPVQRLRGETIRKEFNYTGQVFFAISGFTLFYRVEARRAGL